MCVQCREARIAQCTTALLLDTCNSRANRIAFAFATVCFETVPGQGYPLFVRHFFFIISNTQPSRMFTIFLTMSNDRISVTECILCEENEQNNVNISGTSNQAIYHILFTFRAIPAKI